MTEDIFLDSLSPINRPIAESYLRLGEKPHLPETSLLGSAYRTSNLIHPLQLIAIDSAFSHQVPADPNFNLEQRIAQTRLLRQVPQLADHLLEANPESETEFKWVLGKILQESADARKLDNAGLSGFAAQLATGILSPEILLPGAAVTKTALAAKTALQGALTGAKVGGYTAAVSGGVFYSLDYAGKELTTGFDVVAGVAASSLFGAGLGALGGAIAPAVMKRFAKATEQVDETGDVSHLFTEPEATLFNDPAKKIRPEDAGSAEIEPGFWKAAVNKIAGKDLPTMYQRYRRPLAESFLQDH